MNRIYDLRTSDDIEVQTFLSDKIFTFNQALKKKVIERWGSTKILQQVALWQALVGGSIEVETDITPEQRDFVNTEILTFIEELEKSLNTV
jgi:hypothetical protein